MTRTLEHDLDHLSRQAATLARQSLEAHGEDEALRWIEAVSEADDTAP